MELTKPQKIVGIVCLGFCLAMMISLAWVFFGPEDFFSIFPGPGSTDFLLAIGLPLGISILFARFIPRAITPLILSTIRKTRKSVELLHIPAGKNYTFSAFFSRAVLPVLLTFSISYQLATYIPANIIFSNPVEPVYLSINLGLFLIPFALLFSIIIWTFEDQGIGSWRRDNARKFQNLEGIGKWLSTFVQGYAGISTIIIYVQIVFDVTISGGGGGNLGPQQFFGLMAPILAMGIFIANWGVAAVVYEKHLTVNDPKLLKKYNLPTCEAKIEKKEEPARVV